MKFKLSLVLLFSFFLAFSSENFKSLEDDFLVFNPKFNAYMPLIEPITTQNTVSFYLSKNENLNTFKIIAGVDLSIFLDNKFHKNIPKSDTFIISIDLFLKHKKSFVTIASKKQLNNTYIYCYDNKSYKKSADTEVSALPFGETLKLKKNANQKYIFGLIFCILCFVSAKMFFPEVLVNIFPAISSNQNRSYGTNNSKVQLFQNEVIVQISLVVTLLLIGSWVFLDREYIQYIQNSTLIGVFSLTFFYIVLLIIKIFLHLVFSMIFKTALLSKTLIIEYSYMMLFFVLFLVPFLFLLFSPYFNLDFLNIEMLITIKVLVFILLFAREIYVSYKIIGFRKKYLFAYICICDIFPFIYLLKITQDFSIL